VKQADGSYKNVKQGGMYVLGNIFLNNYYVVYDLENYRVGLVPSINSTVGETLVV
jgi:hypothetical protein